MTPSGHRRCSDGAVALIACSLVLLAAVASSGASAIRHVDDAHGQDAGHHVHRRDVTALLATSGDAVVREKRTLHKLKPLIVLPAKIALGTGAKLVAGARLGAKAVGLGAKALGVGAVGLKAVKKVAKVTVKAATALGIKAVLLNFLFQKINQVIDFKTRLLSNLDQRNRQQNAQFLSPSKSSIGNKEDDDFLASSPGDQQVLAQEQSKSPTVAPLQDDDDVTFDPNKISLQVPDRLFGPSFTAVNSISQIIGNVVQNTAGRLARFVQALKNSIFRKVSAVSSISNSSGGGDGSATGTRGSRDAATDLGDDGLDLDPLDEAISLSANGKNEKRNTETTSATGVSAVDGGKTSATV